MQVEIVDASLIPRAKVVELGCEKEPTRTCKSVE